ncbi:MAG: hypothetical protein CM15mV22_2240 [Eurybiavirus sp.]|nr:MAG: hypothetical protein CM15mV22_2240 [Eurybiavirus sp.]
MSGTSSSTPPTHESGTLTDGSMTWTYLRKRTDGNLVQGGWSTLTGGSNYNNGTYYNVPIKVTNVGASGKGGKATIVVSGNTVSSVTITDPGTAYNVGDTITADNVNIGNAVGPAGSGFTITLTEVETEAQVHCTLAHQVKVGDKVNISGITPTEWNKTDYTVIRTETLRKFTVKRNFASIASATITNAEVYVEEPQLQLINGHKYTFDTSDASNVGKTLAFTFDLQNTDIFTYKNITDEVRDSITGDQNSITILIEDVLVSSIISILRDLQAEVSSQRSMIRLSVHKQSQVGQIRHSLTKWRFHLKLVIVQVYHLLQTPYTLQAVLQKLLLVMQDVTTHPFQN